MAKPSQKQQPGVERGTSDTPGKNARGIDPEGIADSVPPEPPRQPRPVGVGRAMRRRSRDCLKTRSRNHILRRRCKLNLSLGWSATPG